jgi:hypothetical protein
LPMLESGFTSAIVDCLLFNGRAGSGLLAQMDPRAYAASC